MRPTTLLAFVLLTAFPALAQNYLEGVGGFSKREAPPLSREELLARQISKEGPKYRTVNGVANQIWKAANWGWFYGKVTTTGADLLVHGNFTLDGQNYTREEASFQLRNYPGQVADDDKIGSVWTPIRVKLLPETETYKTPIGASRTVRVLDFGVPCKAPLPPVPKIVSKDVKKPAPAK